MRTTYRIEPNNEDHEPCPRVDATLWAVWEIWGDQPGESEIAFVFDTEAEAERYVKECRLDFGV